MAKMFYSLDEAAAKLGMDETEVQSLAESGQLQEFRDRDKLMFKVEQVDLLAGDADIDDDITLAEDTAAGIEPISLSSTGSASAFSLESSGEGTGVSIFEPDDGDAVDANADTLVSGGGLGGSGFNMDAGASGSGLAQLAFEPDDTSLGGNLLDDLAADSQAGASQGGSAIGDTAFGGSVAGALFEGTSGSDSEFAPAAPAMMPMAGAEPYDGAASGLFGGAALGMVILLMVSLAVMVLGMTGGSQQILGKVDTNMLYMIAGGGAGIIVIFAIVGWVMLRKS
ncbi:MAG: helix-turn-helix domain-containing protein [Phycisphaerales bacterium]|nr:helix-turn-helix domain-containing protein [Phycisphaerales bacterium]